MSKPTAIALILLAVFVPIASAQREHGLPDQLPNPDVLIRVVFDNDRQIQGIIKVQLLNNSENSLIDGISSDGTGEVTFHSVPPGGYKIRVTGTGIEEQVFPSFTVRQGEVGTHIEIVRVKRKVDKDADQPTTGAPVSVTMLNVPEKARKEYEKGMEALGKNDLGAAHKHLSNAVKIYPKYAEAMNSLGVVALKTGDQAAGRGYFQQAIAADGTFASAYVNLARLDFGAQRYSESDASLQKALASEPLNLEALSLLAVTQFSENKLEDAVATARKVHSLPHEKYAMVHYLAGAALDKLNRRDEAIEEFQIFLEEAPNSPSADKARNALRILQQK